MKKTIATATIAIIIVITLGGVAVNKIMNYGTHKNELLSKPVVSMKLIEKNSHNGTELDGLTYEVFKGNTLVATEKLNYLDGTYTFKYGKENYTKPFDRSGDILNCTDLINNVYNNLKEK